MVCTKELSHIYRRDHVDLAKALRNAGAITGVDDKVLRTFTDHIADVCEDRTPGGAVFDRGLFLAYALSPVPDELPLEV